MTARSRLREAYEGRLCGELSSLSVPMVERDWSGFGRGILCFTYVLVGKFRAQCTSLERVPQAGRCGKGITPGAGGACVVTAPGQ